MDDRDSITNDLLLSGRLEYKQVKSVGDNKKMFRAKICNVKVVAWNELANDMDKNLSNGDIVTVRAVVNERSYKANCRKCNSEYTAYWVDAEIYQFKKENN